MKKFNSLSVVLFLLCAMGLWGCTQQKTGAISAKVRDLETRHAKLEEDYKTLQTTNDLASGRWTRQDLARLVRRNEGGAV